MLLAQLIIELSAYYIVATDSTKIVNRLCIASNDVLYSILL